MPQDHAAPHPDSRAASLSLVWLAAALFVWGVGESMFYIFQPIYLARLGANPVTTGAILGAAAFVMVLAHIPAGHLSDRIGRRPLLITAWITGIIATWIMALAPSLPLFVVGLLLYGFTAFVSSPLNSYVTAARGAWSVGRALTLISASYNLGVVLGPFTGGWIGDRFGLRSIYFVAGFLFIISTVFLWFIAPQPRDRHDPAAPPPGLASNRRYIAFVGVGFLVMLATFLPQPLTSRFLQEVRGLSLSQIGLLGAVGGAGNTLLTLALGFLDARLGFVLGQAGVGLFSLLLWQTQGLPWYALAYFLLGGFRAVRMLFMALLRPLVHESQMGLAYGVSESILGLTAILAPLAAGFIYERDPLLIYPIALCAILVAGLVSIFMSPRPTAEPLSVPASLAEPTSPE